MISGNINTHTLSLFGLKSAAVQQGDATAKIAELAAQKAELADQEKGVGGDNGSRSVSSGGAGEKFQFDPVAWREESEKRRAKMLEHFNQQQAFIEEHGFRQQATDGLKRMHRRAGAYEVGTAGFASWDDAMWKAQEFVSDLVGAAGGANGKFNDNSDWLATFTPGEQEVHRNRSADNIEASNLKLDIAAGQIRRSFGNGEPLFTRDEDGRVSVNAFEIRHPKYGLLISVDEGGRYIMHDEDGNGRDPNTREIVTVDRKI